MIADLETQRALDRYHQVGVSGLAEEERTLATIWYFESKVANGGFEHFYKSREGEFAPFAPEAFRMVGAKALAGIAERANAVFGPAGVPSEKEERRQRLAGLSPDERQVFERLEAEYASYGRDLDGCLESYLARRRGR